MKKWSFINNFLALTNKAYLLCPIEGTICAYGSKLLEKQMDEAIATIYRFIFLHFPQKNFKD